MFRVTKFGTFSGRLLNTTDYELREHAIAAAEHACEIDTVDTIVEYYDSVRESHVASFSWLDKNPLIEPKYTIEFPGAKGMIDQEKRCKQIPSEHYDGNLRYRVAQQIHNEIWLDSHQCNVDKVLALVHKISNAPKFQKALLEMTLAQLDDGDAYQRVRFYDIKMKNEKGEQVV